MSTHDEQAPATGVVNLPDAIMQPDVPRARLDRRQMWENVTALVVGIGAVATIAYFVTGAVIVGQP